MTKRIFGLFLALCLVVGVLPMIALAAEEAEKPAPEATVSVTSGTNAEAITFAPEMTEGMAPAYAKTTAEGAIVLDGATEADFNLKVEWPTGGTPTLTIKNATIVNDTYYVDSASPAKPFISIGGKKDFVIIVKGTNTFNGRHNSKPLTTAAYRSPTGVKAQNEGTLTIKGDSKADTWTIDNYSGAIIEKYYNALTIETVTFAGYIHNTGSNAQYGVTMNAGKTELLDKTDLTVRNADFTIEDKENKYHGNYLIMMCGTKGNTYSETNTSDLIFINSKVRLYRNNGTSSSQDGSTAIKSGPNSKIIIDRCDFYLYARYRTINYWPEMKNVDIVSAGDFVLAAGTKVNSTTLPKLQLTHQCGTEGNGDCTKAQTCDVCGKELSPAQSAHVAAADDGDCTTAITCANLGCKVVMTEAKAAHVAAADDGDCTTAIKCANAGCTKIVVEAKASHTSPASRTSCNEASACAVCNKALAAGEHTGGAATCKDKKKCELCQAEYGELADHAGGTATCKDKAVCATCNQPYGELSTIHTPAEDDGDCTTAIKCTVCDAELVAAKTHAFTDSKDTACDNPGCKHTRTITNNPNTGDISILMTAAVALSSAVGFAGVTVLRKKEN